MANHFSHNQRPDPQACEEIAIQNGLATKQVRTWLQNQRQRRQKEMKSSSQAGMADCGVNCDEDRLPPFDCLSLAGTGEYGLTLVSVGAAFLKKG